MFNRYKKEITIILLLIAGICLLACSLSNYDSHISKFTDIRGEKYKLTSLTYNAACSANFFGQHINKCPTTLYKYDDYITIADDKILINDGDTAIYEIIKREVNDGNEIYHIGDVNVNLIKDANLTNVVWNTEYNKLPPNTKLYRQGNKLSTADNSFSLEFTNIN